MLKTGMYVVLIALMLTGIGWLARLDASTIQTVSVSGNDVVDRSDLERVVSNELEGAYAFLFPKRNIFLYPKEHIKTSVHDAFSRISNVEITRQSLTEIHVRVKERDPHALWCGVSFGVLPEASEEGEGAASPCYFLDSSGFVFTRAPDFTGSVFLRYYGALPENRAEAEGLPARHARPHPHRQAQAGGQFIAISEFRFLDTLVAVLEGEFGFMPEAVELLSGGDGIIHMENGLRILFSRAGDGAVLLDNVRTVFSSEHLQDHSDISYIDMRFGNKIFYK